MSATVLEKCGEGMIGSGSAESDFTVAKRNLMGERIEV
jgi:hypothetical protein